ncbi:SPOR domain-containing protein [Xanthobacteraceae bacterium Astr-EGSB]|uniref:SPOR domain-containing protein n=1 Tax=Astrobacterium formosum TaxID=3069710 RepID=UPI0027B328C3|nr:SPOR domain-containing protein [Xanthobacteraceae bacterium Astr-EGSB]
MADDRYSRVTRPGEALRRETPPAGQEVDPLMELARLIGQADPFADLKREREPAPRPAPRIADPSTWQKEEGAPAAPAPTPPPMLRHSLATPLRPETPPPRAEMPPPRVEPRQEPRLEPRPEPRFEPHPEPPLFRTAAPEPSSYDYGEAPRGYDAAPAAQDPRAYDPRGYDDRGYEAPPQATQQATVQNAGARNAAAYEAGAYDAAAYEAGAYDAGAYDAGAYDERGGPATEEVVMHVEPEALDTWRPNDPYHHTEGMFPSEPQVFADPAFAPAPSPAAPPAAAGHYETRRAPQRPAGAVFDPDDPLGFERDAPQAEARGQGGYVAPAPVGTYPDPRGEAAYPAGVAADRVRTIVDRDRGLAEAPARGAQAPRPDPTRALHPDAYLRQPAAPAAPYVAPYGEAGADELPYSAEELAAHYAQSGERVPPRRSRAVVLAVVAFALVFVGAAGAFGYRLMFSGPSKPAPVIRADASPAKVVPAPSGEAGKQIQDRLADKTSAEKVVPREEQPVEIRDASRPPTPRMVYPNQTAGAAPSAVQAPSAPAPFAAAAAPVTGGEAPKKIRTVTIRSDQAPDSSAKTAPARSDPNAPISLSPTAVAPAAPRLAAAPPASHGVPSGSGYVVQVSAQKTQAEAQAAFRTLQGRYPGQLGGRSPIIRRKDTASGTMYGTQVGPFASRDEAIQLCEGLKSAGGSCFVQRN